VPVFLKHSVDALHVLLTYLLAYLLSDTKCLNQFTSQVNSVNYHVPTRQTSSEYIPASRNGDSSLCRTTAWTDSSRSRRTTDVCRTWCCRSTAASLQHQHSTHSTSEDFSRGLQQLQAQHPPISGKSRQTRLWQIFWLDFRMWRISGQLHCTRTIYSWK